MEIRTTKAESIDPHHDQPYPDWLYNYGAGVATGVETFNDISEEHVKQFHEQGYLIVRNAFSSMEIKQALDGLTDLIEGKNPQFDEIQFENIDGIDELLPTQREKYVRKLFHFVEFEQRLKDVAYSPKLLQAIRQLVGNEEQLFMFQDMALLKPPFIGREKPWHQDMAYFNVPLETKIVGAWIALDEARVENGCMIVIPGSHKNGPVIHFERRDWQICDTDVMNDKAGAVPLPPGGCLLFHGLIHHGTPANRSSLQRRALQFHYRAAHVETTLEAERLALFGSEGKDVTC